MSLLLIAALSSPVSSSVQRECRIEDVKGVIVEEGPNSPPNDPDAFKIMVEGCKRHFGPSACPLVVEFNARTNHTNVRCGTDVNTTSKE